MMLLHNREVAAEIIPVENYLLHFWVLTKFRKAQGKKMSSTQWGSNSRYSSNGLQNWIGNHHSAASYPLSPYWQYGHFSIDYLYRRSRDWSFRNCPIHLTTSLNALSCQEIHNTLAMDTNDPYIFISVSVRVLDRYD